MQKIDFFEFVDKIVSNKMISHAYLFELNNYDSDYFDVLKFVKVLMCKNNFGLDVINNCDSCNLCKLIDNGNCPDFFIIEPDGREIKKSQLLWIRDEYKNKSLFGLKRVYLIKYAEKMNLSAANSMLKFLEEPNSGVIAILLTTNRFKMLDTIVSRCQCYKFGDSSNFNEENSESELIFMNCLLNDILFEKYNYLLENIFIDKLNLINLLKNMQKKILLFIEDSTKVSSEYKNVLMKFSIDKLSDYIYIFEDVLYRLNYNVNYKLIVDYMFSRLIGGVISV